jgi:hypothetical protein
VALVTNSLMLLPFGHLEIFFAFDLVQGNQANSGKVQQPGLHIFNGDLADSERIAPRQDNDWASISAAIVVDNDKQSIE